MSRGNAFVSVLAVLVCAYGCGKADLSRGKAEALISQSKDMQALRTSVPLYSGGYKKGIQQGMWREEFNDQRRRRLTVLTDKGKGSFKEISQVGLFGFGAEQRFVAPVAEIKVPSVKVTGIAKEGDTQRSVDFSWTYVDLPSVVKRFVVAGGSGKASFKLFDDGWRLDQIGGAVADEAVSLSDKEKAEEQADVQAAAKEAQGGAAQK
jgi:hypothetical protein